MANAASRAPGSAIEVFWAALRLGLTSFGGPVAHLGYYREEYVRRRRWLDDAAYGDLVALCQSLPGPTSSQVGIAIGTLRAGWLGGLLSFIGFTAPSAIAMIAFAYGVTAFDVRNAGWLHGLVVAAVAVVANAVWGMALALATGRTRASIAILAAAVMLLAPSPLTQVLVIAAGAVGGAAFFAGEDAPTAEVSVDDRVSRLHGRRAGAFALALFLVLLAVLPVAAHTFGTQALALIDANYRAGSLVLGGGHLVLPLLRESVVPPGWVTDERFIAGYGAAQAVPGPLFTFAAYLGAVEGPRPNGWAGGLIALGAIYVPTFLMVWGMLPFWDRLRTHGSVQAGLRGASAAVVGILLAALYTPVWTSAIHAPADFALAVVCFGLLTAWKLPPWLVVVVAALGGQALALV